MIKNTKDYIRNKFASEELADTIRDWWHSRGYSQVKVWVEEEKHTTQFGARLPSNYYVRSNITFSVDTIKNRMIQ